MSLSRKSKFGLLLGVILCSVAGGGFLYFHQQKPTPPPKNVNIQPEAKKILKKHSLTGEVVLIKNHKPYFIKNLTPQEIKFKDKLIYPTASLEKPMAAVMLMQVMSEKQNTSTAFTLNTTIKRWFPDLPKAHKITVSDLLSQTSGIVDPLQEVDFGKKLTEKQVFHAVVQRLKDTPQYNPGNFSYNNDNFVLLAAIISRETHKSYAQNLQDRLVIPLKLKDTFMWNQVPADKQIAGSYHDNQSEPVFAPPSLLSELIGAASLYSTPQDYYRFLKAVTDSTLLSPKTYHQLTHLKTATGEYSGGFFTKSADQYAIYGSLVNTDYINDVLMTPQLNTGLIAFYNESSGTLGLSISQTRKELWNLIQ